MLKNEENPEGARKYKLRTQTKLHEKDNLPFIEDAGNEQLTTLYMESKTNEKDGKDREKYTAENLA